jgi:hypothetical protein
MTRRPFARVSYRGGRSATFAPEPAGGRSLFLAASDLIDVARR